MSTPVKLYVSTTSGDSAAPTSNGKDVSSTNTYYSKMFGGFGAEGYDLHVEWTGTPTGTLTLQVSNKPNPDETDDDDWVTTTETTMVNPAGSASKFRVVTMTSPGKKRLKYVNSSGTGTLYAHVIVPRTR